MKVFFSWSGEKSKATAEALKKFLEKVIQAVEPFISTEIKKGSRGIDTIRVELENTKIGILCLNKENTSSEWILFEAGALSKTQDAHVCTFLLDMTPSDVKPPLGQFQHTIFSKADIKKLIHTINIKLSDNKEKPIPDQTLNDLFDALWAPFEKELSAIKETETTKEPERSDRDILEEILQIVRTDSQQVNNAPLYTVASLNEHTNYHNILNHNLL